MLVMIVAYVMVGLSSCVALAPMFMAGVAFAQDAMLWGVYPILAVVWFVMFSDWMSSKLKADAVEEVEEDEEVD